MKYYFEILKKFNDFYGTASREEFKHFAFIHTAIICVLLSLGHATDHALAIKVLDTLTGLFVVGSALSCAALIVRRLNALGKNPKLVFTVLVPVVGLLYILVICMQNKNTMASAGLLGRIKGMFPKRQQVL